MRAARVTGRPLHRTGLPRQRSAEDPQVVVRLCHFVGVQQFVDHPRVEADDKASPDRLSACPTHFLVVVPFFVVVRLVVDGLRRRLPCALTFLIASASGIASTSDSPKDVTW